MQAFYENVPFICIFLAIVIGILSAAVTNGRLAYLITLLSSLLIGILSALLLAYVVKNDYSFTYTMGKFIAPFGNTIKVGPLQALFAMVFSVVMALSLVGGEKDLFHDILPEKQSLYFVMINLLLASLLALVYTNDIFTGYVFIEISTIVSCALVMAKENGINLIVTIRYLFISLIGSGMFLVGLTLLLSVGGYLVMPNLSDAVALLVVSGDYQLPLTASAALIVIGLGIKSAMFPFHRWLPGAHGAATTASSAILSGLVLKGYIVLMITLVVRVFTLELMVKLGLTSIILVFGLLGMIFGSVEAIREHHIKRMLAYSSVAQVGYIFLGIGLGTEVGIMASCYHILVHACCKPLLFCCAGRLSAVTSHRRSLKNLRGSAYRDYTAGIGFTVGAMSMIGIPLFGGFISKLYFANASLSSDKMAITLLVIVLSTVLNALYYIPAVYALWIKAPAEEEAIIPAEVKPETLVRDRSFITSATLLILAVFFLGTFYLPITDVILAGIRLL